MYQKAFSFNQIQLPHRTSAVLISTICTFPNTSPSVTNRYSKSTLLTYQKIALKSSRTFRLAIPLSKYNIVKLSDVIADAYTIDQKFLTASSILLKSNPLLIQWINNQED